MKTKLRTVITVTTTSIALALASVSHAQLKEPPAPGTYYSAKDFEWSPPWPFNPHPELDVVEIAPGVFIFDDTVIPDTPEQAEARERHEKGAALARIIAADPVLAAAARQEAEEAAAKAAAERKRAKRLELAPWLFGADGLPNAKGREFFENKAGRERALAASRLPGIRPKINPERLLGHRGTRPSDFPALVVQGPADGGEDPLYLTDWFYDAQQNLTWFELSLLNAPLNEWWEVYYAPALQSTAWQLARVGPPDGVSGDLQVLYAAIPGQPQQAHFQIFLNKDSDYDGIPDGYEVAILKTDPLNPDSNSTRDANGDGAPDYPGLGGNGIADGDEDFDADGLTTSYEIALGVDPLVPQSGTDTDADGLPDWVESLITLYTGDPAPVPQTDSDGDGVDNFTEWTIRTDPSYGFDAAFADFSGLPDEQRVILPVHIQFTAPPAGFQPAGGGSATTDDEAYIHFTVGGVEGTCGHLQVLKDTAADGSPAPGTDTFRWSVGFGQRIYNTLPLVQPDNQDLALIQNILIEATDTAAEVWKKAKVSENLYQLTQNSLVYLQYRSVQRAVIQFRQLQLIVTAQPLPQGILLRTRRALAVIHTEATIFREVTFELGRRFPLHDAFAKSGAWVAGAGRVAQCLSIYNDIMQAWPLLEQYLFDVQRQCDSGASAELLGYALAQLADDIQPGFVLFPFPLIIGDILCELNPGCGSSCN